MDLKRKLEKLFIVFIKSFLTKKQFFVYFFLSSMLLLGTNGYYQNVYFFENATAQVLSKVLLDQKNIETDFGLYDIINKDESNLNLLSPLRRVSRSGQPNNLESLDILNYEYSPYRSSYGIQGNVISGLYRFLNPIFRFFEFSFSSEVFVLQSIIGFISSIVLMLICYFLYINFRLIYPLTYFIFFFFSPWINMFSFNLYFFSFVWFLPFLVSLLGITYNKHKYLIHSLLIPILLFKGLTSFEFLSSIMLSSFVPLIILLKEKKYKFKVILKDIISVSIFSIIGVSLSFIIFSYKKGKTILEGLQNIFTEDALRRTIEVSDISGLSFIKIITKFSVGMFSYENILIHINSAILFILLILIPLISFRFSRIKIIEYLFYLFIPYSWIILSFNHSYNHYFIIGILFFLGTFQYLFIESITFISNGFEKK